MDPVRKRELAERLVRYLVGEAREHGTIVPNEIAETAADENASFDRLWLAFRTMVNVRPPWPAPTEFLVAQNELLQGMIGEAGIHTIADAAPSSFDDRIRLWRGDITTLAADAVVNAANSGMTGCWAPLHYCIDNAIHTFAGVQLRAEMARFMEEQGHEQPTAQAEVSPGYNLPAKHVIHIVGPIANGHPTDLHREQLAQSYRACLDAASKLGCLSIAFCCISTGVFGFPQQEAAEIAVSTVRQWYDENPASSLACIFDVYGEDDEAIYRDLLM